MSAKFDPTHEHYCWLHQGTWPCREATCMRPHEETCPLCDEELDGTDE